MKKITALGMAIMLGCVAASAQYMCTEAGTVMKFKSTSEVDGKQVENSSTETVDSVWTDADGLENVRILTIEKVPGNDFAEIKTYSYYSYNPADKLTIYKMMTGDEYKRVMLNQIEEEVRAQGQVLSADDRAKIEDGFRVKGELDLNLPAEIDPAAKVPNRTIKISMGTMTMSMSLWEVKYAGFESVTVPAGTYEDCLKVTYVFKMNTPAGVEKSYATSWFAKGLGEIKTVMADKKGNVKSEGVLESISKK